MGDQGELIRKAVQYFNEEQVAWVFHCGDWVSPFILYFFQELQAPMRGVFGNNDGDKFRHLALKNKWGINLESATCMILFTIIAIVPLS